MEKDPRVVERLAAQRADENWKLRSFLKHLPAQQLARVNELARVFGAQAAARMDCRECGACCRSHHIPVNEAEVQRLAGLVRLPVLDFRDKYLDTDIDGDPALPAPCPFLDGTLCAIYEHRPQACRGYPYLEEDLTSCTVGVIERAGTCPIVFEMLEQLKMRLGFMACR